ncbi:hypothetical protein M3Y95_00180100 [Aphelenchoides besseyi]|nr:hypothetical protein M3Y95_00180100 [Aphelenchoides besseyi]
MERAGTASAGSNESLQRRFINFTIRTSRWRSGVRAQNARVRTATTTTNFTAVPSEESSFFEDSQSISFTVVVLFCFTNHFVDCSNPKSIFRFLFQSIANSMTTQFTKLFAFILANVNDPSPPFENAYRLQCFSCMSPYLEDQFVYISHLYRKPLSFTDRCDRQNFDWHQVQAKNCSDLCVTLRMNDKVGGRRRNGYLRGCMSDIKFYNRSILYYGDMMRTGQSSQTRCQTVRLRDLFAAPDWFGLEVNDHVELCTCATPYCNAANSSFDQFFWLIGLLSLWSTLNWSFFPTRRKPELLNAN